MLDDGVWLIQLSKLIPEVFSGIRATFCEGQSIDLSSLIVTL